MHAVQALTAFDTVMAVIDIISTDIVYTLEEGKGTTLLEMDLKGACACTPQLRTS